MVRRTLAMLIATTTAASAQIVGANADSIPRDSWVGIYFRHYDRAARAAYLAPLRDTQLHMGEREVRIWTEVALGEPKHLYRFTEQNGRVRGEQIEYWSIDPLHSSPAERPGETWQDLMLYGLKGRCDGFVRSPEMGICRVRFRREPPWSAVLRDAASRGLWALPDPSVLPPDHMIGIDGWSIVVELRDGPRYRTYHYHNPESHTTWPSAMQASEIAHTLRRIDSLAHLPDAWRLYRGITTGRYQSAFRSCDGAEWEFHDDLRWRVQRASPEIRASVPALADSTARDSTRSQRDSTIYEVEVLGELTPVWVARRWASKFPRALQVMELRAVHPSPTGACLPASRR